MNIARREDTRTAPYSAVASCSLFIPMGGMKGAMEWQSNLMIAARAIDRSIYALGVSHRRRLKRGTFATLMQTGAEQK
jgi:hypothetical protein